MYICVLYYRRVTSNHAFENGQIHGIVSRQFILDSWAACTRLGDMVWVISSWNRDFSLREALNSSKFLVWRSHSPISSPADVAKPLKISMALRYIGRKMTPTIQTIPALLSSDGVTKMISWRLTEVSCRNWGSNAHKITNAEQTK